MKKILYAFLFLVLILSSCKLKEDTTVSPDGGQTVTSIKVILPNGGESLPEGSSYQIQWTGTGTTLVRIQYSIDNGTTWSLVVDSLSNSGLFNWQPVPNTISNQCRIRISTLDGKYSDDNDKVFAIVRNSNKSLRIISPVGKESWEAGTEQKIKWFSSGLDSVKLEYTTNNGQKWNTITIDKKNTGVYSWEPVPNTPSILAKVRISDAKEGILATESPEPFEILPERIIKVTVPNGGEQLVSGSSSKIEYISENIEKVKIAYTTNNGFNWITIVDAVQANGFYNWAPIPNVDSKLCKVRIYNANGGLPTDFSDDVFTITSAALKTLTLISPKGGELWQVGTNQNITWSSTGIQKVKIEYSTNNGLTWNVVADQLNNTGVYEWVIPNSISSQCLVKVSDATDSKVSAVTTTTFKITAKPEIKVVAPNGGESITEGSSFEIKWIGSGTDYVKIAFTADNGGTWYLIADSLKNTGIFNWFPIPNMISTQCKIRIFSADAASSDESDNSFSIVRNSNESLKLNSPAGGESWEAGTSKQIKWYSSGIDSVKIEYTTNNGGKWNTVAVDKKNTGVFFWEPIPNTPSTLARIRIMDAKDGIPSSESEIFTILPEPKLRVISPNGDEVILAGTSRKIEWLSENIEKVKIAYTTNNGFTWLLIKDQVPSTGFYVWESVPNVNSQLCKIRIYDAQDGEPNDVSDNTFTITNQISQTLEVTAPNGGEKWQAGTNQSITWKSTGVTTVKVEFTSNNGLTWNTIVDQLANTGAYEWNIPNSISTQCLIKISDAVDSDPIDQSNGTFRIVPKPKLEISYPNGGENWVAGIIDTIKWASVGVENVTLEYTPNNGTSWFTIVEKTPSSGSYPTSFSSPGTQYKIRITDKENGSPQDESNGTFTVSPEPKISVISPNGNEEWYAGSANNIKWISTNIENVKIEYTTNNGATWTSIVESTASDGVYTWDKIPNDVSSLQCRVRISDAKDGIPSDVSDENFSIITYGVQLLKVTSPNGNEKWIAGSTQVITWDAAGILNVKIEYTLNNGLLWNVITNSTPSTGHYTWAQIPTTSSTNCKIRISDATDSAPSDESDLFFTIEPEPIIKVITPKGGEVWTSGTTQEIRWESQNVANVKIEFTTDAGANWATIINSTPSIGYYIWKGIPNVNSLQCRIKISDASDGNPFAMSDNNFQISNYISQTLRVTSPNGGEVWREKQTRTITWESQAITNVNIEYTVNNGLTWSSIVQNLLSSGSYDWAIPAGINSTQCKVRVSDASDGDPMDESNSGFSISPTPEITKILYPTSGVTIIAGESVTIRWESKGVKKVKIEYNRNNLNTVADWFTLADSVENSNSFVTNFKYDSQATAYVIRITPIGDGSPLLSGTFYVAPPPSVTILAPNGNEQWLVSQKGVSVADVNNYHPYEIKWRATNAEKVKIEWSTNGGGKWYPVPDADNTENDGIFVWAPGRIDNVFDQLGNPIRPDSSDNCYIRIIASSGVSDISDAAFSIHQSKKLRVEFPNKEEYFLSSDVNRYPMTIRWTSYAVTTVDIYYSLDNGVSWVQLTDPVNGYPSTGAYDWDWINDPAVGITTVSTQFRVKILDHSTNSIWDINDAASWLNKGKDQGN